MPKTKKKLPITASQSSLSGPSLIRRVHTLRADLESALKKSDDEKAEEIKNELESLGGLNAYQKASIRGQDKRRGGDSSKILIDWIKPNNWKVLEVGALRVDNYISRFAHVDRIDLNSQNPSIKEIDFLDLKAERYDLLSVSLVLNFVPVSKRSEFLVHTTRFLDVGMLFFVLPSPCIINSRYMSKAILLQIFTILGYDLVHEKVTTRMAYWLFKHVRAIQPGETLKKKEIRSGKDRNNFWIPLVT